MKKTKKLLRIKKKKKATTNYEKIANVLQELLQMIEQQHENDYALIGGTCDTSCYALIVKVARSFCGACVCVPYGRFNTKDLIELYVRFCESEGTVENDSFGIGGAIKELLQLLQSCDRDINHYNIVTKNSLLHDHFRDIEEKLHALEDNYTLKKMHIIPPRRRRKTQLSSSHTTSSSIAVFVESMKKKKVKEAHSWTTICRLDIEISIDLQHNLACDATCTDFSSDGKLLVIGTVKDGVHIYNMKAGTEYSMAENLQSIRSVCFSPDGKCIAASTNEEVIALDIATKQRLFTTSYPKTGIDLARYLWNSSVQYNEGNKFLVHGTNDSTVDIWDIQKGKCVTQLRSDQGYPITAMKVIPGGQLVAAVEFNTVMLWDVHHESPIQKYKQGPVLTSLAFSCDGKLLATTATNSSIKLWDPRSPTCVASYTAMGEVHSVGFSPSGFMAVGTSYGQVLFWDPRFITTHTLYAMLEAHHDCTVHCMTFSYEGGLLATGAQPINDHPGTARIWKGFW